MHGYLYNSNNTDHKNNQPQDGGQNSTHDNKLGFNNNNNTNRNVRYNINHTYRGYNNYNRNNLYRNIKGIIVANVYCSSYSYSTRGPGDTDSDEKFNGTLIKGQYAHVQHMLHKFKNDLEGENP